MRNFFAGFFLTKKYLISSKKYLISLKNINKILNSREFGLLNITFSNSLNFRMEKQSWITKRLSKNAPLEKLVDLFVFNFRCTIRWRWRASSTMTAQQQQPKSTYSFANTKVDAAKHPELKPSKHSKRNFLQHVVTYEHKG